ncbi:MAG: dihydropteroate synthase [Planctomycetota bacterium]|nr:MAG: dihydropteroate synthase [Planctomycetota bacterium]
MTKINNTLTDFGFTQKSFVIMGVLNITPDSFSDGGEYTKLDCAMNMAKKMIQDGASIIDIGGESTRPGAEEVSAEEEKKRVLPVIKEIRKFSDVAISIDTTKAVVAEEALLSGANIINDISGTTFDPEMIDLIRRFKPPTIIMHTSARPKEMQSNTNYENIIQDITDFLKTQFEKLVEAGLSPSDIIIDPGIGFGKTYEQNIEILKKLSCFKSITNNILLGVSRKSLFKTMLEADVKDRLAGTIATNLFAFQQGIKYFRVHDVLENVHALKTINLLATKKETT